MSLAVPFPLAVRERVETRHTGPVWQVAWAHPKFGDILASCSYDGKVIIWKEQLGQGPGAGGWTKIKEHTLHKASGACIAVLASFSFFSETAQ